MVNPTVVFKWNLRRSEVSWIIFLFEYFKKKKKDKNLKRKKLETFNFIYLIILRGEKFLN